MANIEIKTTGVRGNPPKLEKKGQVVLFIDDAKDGSYIYADSYIGQGSSYKKRDKTLIEIREDYKVLFSGTFAELIDRLKK